MNDTNGLAAGELSELHREIVTRLGTLPNFFCTAMSAPRLIGRMWSFARSAYIDNPLPSLFKERLFVHLSRFCEVRYCIVRHVGFLAGHGYPAGDLEAPPHSIGQIITLLTRAVPDRAAFDAVGQRLHAQAPTDAIPASETDAESDLLDALTLVFLEPRRSASARNAIAAAYGPATLELLTALLAFVRMAHFWTETHADLTFEPEMLLMMEAHDDLRRLLLAQTDAERTWSPMERAELLSALDEQQARLRASEQRLDALIRSSSDVRYMLNADWTELTELTGGGFISDAAESKADWVDSYIPAEDRASVRAEIARAIASKSDYRLEHRVNRVDGTVGWASSHAVPLLNDEGRITGWVGAASDISDRRRAQERLEQTVEEQTAARDRTVRERDRLWSMPNLLLAVVGFDTTMLAVNPGWRAMLGWSEAELVGRSSSVILHPDDVGRSSEWADRLAAGHSLEDLVNRLRCKDGSFRTFSWTITPEGDVFHCVGRDVTVESEQAATLAAAEEQLRQSQKMEAVGQLTGGIAHDFNNLLTGISGSLELLGTRLRQGRTEGLERYIAAAQASANRAAALTHRLLAFSRRQTLDPKPTDVNAMVLGLEELLRRTVGPGVAIEIKGEPSLWATRIDANQLENAILNLCLNARDAMPGGGRIVIETSNRTLDPDAARKRDLAAGDYVTLCVTDTGVGMEPEVVAKAFDPFFTTKPLGQGTGLGLSMIYGFVLQSGGQVHIFSKPGDGTTVCIHLPRLVGDGGARTPAEPSLPTEGEPQHSGTVLIVDDEPTIRSVVAEVLEELGLAVIEAADGAAGLRVLQSDIPVSLLVTDVGLPGGMNGRQLADAARATRPTLKVVFITGYADTMAVGDGRLALDMHVLTKPFAMGDLTKLLQHVLDQEQVAQDEMPKPDADAS